MPLPIVLEQRAFACCQEQHRVENAADHAFRTAKNLEQAGVWTYCILTSKIEHPAVMF